MSYICVKSSCSSPSLKLNSVRVTIDVTVCVQWWRWVKALKNLLCGDGGGGGLGPFIKKKRDLHEPKLGRH